MGRDKAIVEVDGVAMAARVAAALRVAGCHPVFAVGGDQPALEAMGIEFVTDLHPGEGPVGGVITALKACAPSAVVVVACDLPFLTADTVSALVEAANAAQAVVAVTDRVQPMCALWSQSAFDVLRREFDAGERRLLAVLDQLETRQIPANPQDLANVNTPDDLPQ